MSEVYEPNADLRDRAHVKSMDDYREEYARSIADPEAFWAAKAAEFHWFKKWDTVRSYNYNMDAGPMRLSGLPAARPTLRTIALTGTSMPKAIRSPSSGRATSRGKMLR